MTDDRLTELSAFLDFGEEAVAEASTLLKRYFRKTIAMAKGPFDVVTEADHAVESMFGRTVGSGLPRSCHGR